MRRTLPSALLLSVVAALVAASAAQGASSVVVRGAGFGHGIGMSQFGAYGFAQRGVGYERILRHYYRGTTLRRAPSRPVRVLLQASDPAVRFRGATRATGGRALNPRATYVVRGAPGGQLVLTRGRRRVATVAAPLRVTGSVMRLLGRAINGVHSGLYRSSFEFTPGSAGGVTAVNALALDAYVRGVVAGEMPSSWHVDALRAQSVTARSYALATRKTGGVFDQYPDTRSQVYRGVSGETARTNQAVADTAGRILTYGGAPAVTYYFSTSGGRTENVELSFLNSEPKPWLRSVEDPYDGISPRHRWRLRFSAARLGARLGAPGRYRKIRVLRRGRSPRIVRARVYGSRGTRVLTGAQIRARLKLYDSWAYFTTITTSQVRRFSFKVGGAAVQVRFPRMAGSVDPVPRSRTVSVERRGRHGWGQVKTVRTSRRGAYRTEVIARGVYRVRAGPVAGPALRIR
jgi:stage II sporulation protein D